MRGGGENQAGQGSAGQAGAGSEVGKRGWGGGGGVVVRELGWGEGGLFTDCFPNRGTPTLPPPLSKGYAFVNAWNGE